MTEVVVVGAGLIGLAIARRVGAGKHVLLADLREETARLAARVLSEAGFKASVAVADVSSRDSVRSLAERAASLGSVTGLIHAAGVSPSQVAVMRGPSSDGVDRAQAEPAGGAR